MERIELLFLGLMLAGLTAVIIGGCAKGTLVVPKESESPRYGGTLTLGYTTDTIGFDDAKREHYGTRTLMLTNEERLFFK